MLRRAFRSRVPNALSAVTLLFVLSGACAEAVVDDEASRSSTGGAAFTPMTGGTTAQPSAGGVGPRTGGAPSVTGGKSSAANGGNPSSAGGRASNPGGGSGAQTGGVVSGGTGSKATGGTTSKATGGTSSKATGGRGSATGGSVSSGGKSNATGGAPAASGGTGSGGGECDFSSPSCEELGCQKACPTNMGTYCATACQAVIGCLEKNPSCSSLELCVERLGSGAAAPCTMQWEQAGGSTMSPGSPAAVVSEFFECSCGGEASAAGTGGGEAGAAADTFSAP